MMARNYHPEGKKTPCREAAKNNNKRTCTLPLHPLTQAQVKTWFLVAQFANSYFVVPGPKQSFKCQKCGKCYNWNYNLNRHMRFECGIENRFECSMCHKRFPYKQNVAIHLKRKHKLQLDNADDMIAQGHITLLPGAKNDDNSWNENIFIYNNHILRFQSFY